MQLHFCRVAVFVALYLQLYSAFGDDLQDICLYSMVALHITFARIIYSLREDKLFSSRGHTFLLARIVYSLREENNICMVSILKINGLQHSFYYYLFYCITDKEENMKTCQVAKM